MKKRILILYLIVLIVLVGNSWVRAAQPNLKDKGQRKEFRLSAPQAIKIAQMHIRRSNLFDMTKNPRATQLFPLYNPNNKTSISHFEVKVSERDNPDAGYIIISTDEKNIPIPEFSTQGKTYTEKLRRLSRREISKVFWHGPTVAYAEDRSGNRLGYVGPELITVDEVKNEWKNQSKKRPYLCLRQKRRA
jgi:hypothetical protein